MRLILAEKPSVAAEFAQALGAQKRQGYYESPDTLITYCFGHLLRLYSPEDYDPSLIQWKVETLPIIPEHFRYSEITEASRQLATIRQLLSRNPSPIIIATDAGREGELIARETLTWCGKSDLSDVQRFWTSEALTPETINKNLADLKPADRYTPLYLSGYYRMLSDWLVGMNFSRYFTVKLRDIFSFGRVQIPVLAQLVKRADEIAQFAPQPFFMLRATLSKDNNTFFAYHFHNNTTRFDDRKVLDELLLLIESSKPHAKATRIQKEQKSVQSPQLFNLTALQKAANKAYGYSAALTASVAQDLYEKHKVLSYPRTSSRVLARADHALFSGIVSALNPIYPDLFDGCALPSAEDKRIFDDSKLGDHHALLLLHQLPATLCEEEANVALLVLKSMAAVLLGPYVFNSQTIDFDLCRFNFQAKGTQTVSLGWKRLEQPSQDQEPPPDEDDDHTKPLPAIQEGEQLDIIYTDVLEKHTRAPQPYSESALLSLMEHNSLGTEATRADIIEKLLSRKYAFRQKRAIVAADKGAFLIRTLTALPVPQLSQFSDLNKTSEWETKLEKDPTNFFSTIQTFVRTAVDQLRSLDLASYQKKALGNCPHCAQPLKDGPHSYYCPNGCTFSIPHVLCGHKMTDKEVSQLLSGGQTNAASFKSKTGSSFRARLKYDLASRKLVFSFPQTHKPGGSK